MHVVSVQEFRDRDADYLAWVAAHRDGYVINIGRSGARLCPAAPRRLRHHHQQAPVHRPVHQDLLDRPDGPGSLGAGSRRRSSRALRDLPAQRGLRPAEIWARRVGPGRSGFSAGVGLAAGPEWEIEGPGDDRQVWLWATRYIPYPQNGLPPAQPAARDALRLRVRSLAATAGEILDASYSRLQADHMDAENLLLYNIDPTMVGGGCFREAVPGTAYASRWRPAPGAIRRLAGPSPAPTNTG